MGTIGIRQSREILDNVENVVAIELLCAAQAYDLITEKKPMKGGFGTRAAYDVIRKYVPYLDKDRDLYLDIETMVKVLKSGEIVKAVEKAVGSIKGN